MLILGANVDSQDEEGAEEMVKEAKLGRDRNGSVMSKKSIGLDSTPQLSRVGSVQSKQSHLVKQESTASGFSQGSGSSGKNMTTVLLA